MIQPTHFDPNPLQIDTKVVVTMNPGLGDPISVFGSISGLSMDDLMRTYIVTLDIPLGPPLDSKFWGWTAVAVPRSMIQLR